MKVNKNGARVTALDRRRHRDYRVIRNSFAHTATRHSCPVFVGEFAEVARECPIVFVRHEESGALCSAAMLGVEPGRNLFWQDNRWRGHYVPSLLRAQPFAVSSAEDGDRIAICIDEHSPLVLSDGSAGERLFDQGGKETQYLASMTRFLLSIQRQAVQSTAFVQYLEKHALLQEKVILVNLEGGVHHRLTGVYTVDESALGRLPNRDFLALRDRGYLPAIYAHLNSLRRVDNLSRLHARSLAQKKWH